MTPHVRPRTEAGFTLIELLVVIAVLGVLSGVVVFGVGQFVDSSEQAACEIEARTITTAQEAYTLQTGAPGDLDALVAAELLSEGTDLFRIDLVAGSWQLVPLGACAEALPALGAPVADVSDCTAGQVDLNTASTGELDTIIHIGPARADQIVSLRPFESVGDLVRVSGVGSSRLADILAQDLACV